MKKGFTLINVLVGITIISILFGIGIWAIVRQKEKMRNVYSLNSVKSAILYAEGRAYSRGQNEVIFFYGHRIDVKEGKTLVKKYSTETEFENSYVVNVYPTGKIDEKDIFLKSSVSPNCIHVGSKIYIGKKVGNACR